MILAMRFSNFFSFKDEAEVSFQLGKKPAETLYDINLDDGERVNKVISVLGPNGSGKTQLLKPFAFLCYFISTSFYGSKPEDEIPFRPHFASDELTSLEIEFLLGGKHYKYSLDVDRQKVHFESLKVKTSHLFSYVFERQLISSEKDSPTKYEFKQKSFGFTKAQAEKVRGNVSLISAADSYNVELASKIRKFFHKMIFNIDVFGRNHRIREDIIASAEYFFHKEDLKKKMEQLICSFDLGICNIDLQEVKTADDKGKEVKVIIPFGIHKFGDTEYRLPMFEESNGTQSAFVLLKDILPVLQEGGIGVIDEIDNDLHPHLLPYILDLFKHKETNPYDAQLVFSCHTPEMLNLLQKHQIYLVEKIDGESEAWRLDEVTGLQARDNLYAKYMAGALQAVPELT